jgi:CheY-like chemotaxis protein
MKASGPKRAGHDRKLRAIAELLDHTMRMIYSQCFVEGLNPAQWSALRYLDRANPSSHTLTNFARVHCVSKAAASDTIAALVRKKLVVKKKDPHDGRVTRIDLTEKGRTLLGSDPLNLLIEALAKLLPQQQEVAAKPRRSRRAASMRPSPIERRRRPRPATAAETGAMARILLVEDNREFRSMLRDLLRAAGHEVTEAENGRVAIACLGSARYDLLVTDVLLPEADGTEVIKVAATLHEDMPIIAMSGGGRELPAVVALALTEAVGAHRALFKPFRDTELLAAVDDLLPEKRP